MNVKGLSETYAQGEFIVEAAAAPKRKRDDDTLHNDEEEAPAKLRRRQSEAVFEGSDNVLVKMGMPTDAEGGGKQSGLTVTDAPPGSKKFGRATVDKPRQDASSLHHPKEEHLVANVALRQSVQPPGVFQRGPQMHAVELPQQQRQEGRTSDAELLHRRNGPNHAMLNPQLTETLRALGGNTPALGQMVLRDESKTSTDLYAAAAVAASNPVPGAPGGAEGAGEVATSRTTLAAQQLLAAAAAQSHQQAMASNQFGRLVSAHQQQAMGDQQNMMRSILRNQQALRAGSAAPLGRAEATQGVGTQVSSRPAQMVNMLPGLHQMLMNPASGTSQSSLFPPSTAGAMAMQGRGLPGGSSTGGGFDMNRILQNSAHLQSLYAARELQHMNPSIGTAQGLLLGGGGFLPPPSTQGNSSGAGFASSNKQAAGGRAPIDLYMGCDDELLSDHQILLRKQIEYFEAGPHEVQSITHGRRKEIRVGQVGIRCKHCAKIAPRRRPKGAMYYPASLRALYQAAQNMAASHFTSSCEMIGEPYKEQFRAFQLAKASAGHGGKKYWSDCAKAVGIVETEEGLRFKK